MSNCNKCLSQSDLGRCQNYRVRHYGKVVEEEECEEFERDGEK